jgi:hypothetical protein
MSKRESVDLIASGYEWECPSCGLLNSEIEITEQVECLKCKRVYDTQSAEHVHA